MFKIFAILFGRRRETVAYVSNELPIARHADGSIDWDAEYGPHH